MTDEQIQTFVDLIEWAEMLDAEHPANVALRVEKEIDAELPYPVRSPITERRDAILAAFKEEALTAGQANELIGELAEIETKLQEVVDPTGIGWFVFESIQEIEF